MTKVLVLARRISSRLLAVIAAAAALAAPAGVLGAPAAPVGSAASGAVPAADVAAGQAPATDDGPVLLVISTRLDAHASDPRLDEWMGAQVRQFAAALRDQLAGRGLSVDLADLSHDGAPAQAIDARLHAGARPYRYLAEAHWAANDRHQVAIFARFVPLVWEGATVHEAAASDPRAVSHAWARVGNDAGPDAERSLPELAAAFAAVIGLDATAPSAAVVPGQAASPSRP